MIRIVKRLLCLLTAAVFFGNFATVRAAVIPPAENLLPSDTIAFFTVPDCNAVRAASKTSPQMMFWNDPAMKPFHDKFMAKLSEQCFAPLEKDLGMKVSDFANLMQGQLTVAFTDNGSNLHDDVPPGLVAFLDAKDKSTQLQTNLAALVKKWTADGRTIRTQQIRGLSFTAITLSSNDLAGIIPQKPRVTEIGKEPTDNAQKPVDIYFTQYQSLLIVGNSIKALEAAAAHLTGGNVPVIADDSNFATDKLSQFRDNPMYYGWFNGKFFFNLLAQVPDQAPDPDAISPLPQFSPAKIIGALGLADLRSASFVLRDRPDGATAVLHMSTSSGEHSGLLKILALSAKDSSAPAFVPADAIKFSRTRLNGKAAWDELLKTVAAISPQFLAQINAVIDMANASAQQKDPSFDLRNNLFNNLGDDLISYQKSPTGESLQALASPPGLTLLATANPDQVIQSIKMVGSMLAPQDSAPPRDFQGHKIYSVSQRAQRTADGRTITGSPLLLSSANGYVAFGTDPGILEEFLRSSDGKVKPLSATPGFADAIQHAGGSAGGMLGYQNQRESMRTTFKLIKSANQSDLFSRMFAPTFRDWMDFSLLPDYDSVAKYFYISVFSGNTTANGSTVTIYTPRPPQLN